MVLKNYLIISSGSISTFPRPKLFIMNLQPSKLSIYASLLLLFVKNHFRSHIQSFRKELTFSEFLAIR